MEIAHWGKAAFIPVLALLTNLHGTFLANLLLFWTLISSSVKWDGWIEHFQESVKLRILWPQNWTLV